MAFDRIGLTVPAKSEYAKTVRMTAATLGARMGMSFDAVDDLKMAVEEVFGLALGFVGEQGEIVLRFLLDDEVMRIEVPLGGADVSEGIADLAGLILNEVSDEHGLAPGDSGGEWTLYVVKRTESIDVD